MAANARRTVNSAMDAAEFTQVATLKDRDVEQFRAL
jgi:hypothetical protein